MQHWEYAAGYDRVDNTFTNWSDPTTYEQARVDLDRLLRDHGDEGWVINPCVVRRGERHINWQPVYDHAAELLVEVLEGLRMDFAVIGAGIVQGSDVAKIFRKRAQILRNTLPNQNQEYDS